MANPQHRKGAANEWKAVRYLQQTCPDLLVDNPRPKLGAGRKDDEGDLIAFSHASVQVKAYKDYTRACRQAAAGAERQRINWGAPLGIGMVPVHNARQTTVNWLFASLEWPAVPTSQPLTTGLVATAVTYLRDDKSGIARADRVALVRRAHDADMWLGTAEAWIAAYRTWLAAARSAAA